MRRHLALLTAGAFASGSIALSACGLTADYSNLQGGTRDGGESTDAGGLGLVDATDATAPIAEAGAADGDAAGSNGSGDSGDAGPDAGPTFCALLGTPVKLCADFDEGQAVSTGWTYPDTYGGSTIAVTTSSSFSAPGSFLSSINPSGAPASARLEETLPTTSASVHLDFELLLMPSPGSFEIAVVHQVTSDGTTYGVYYREVNSALQVEVRSLSANGNEFDQTWPIGAPGASWVHVVIDVVVSATGSFSVQQNGQTVLSETNVPTSTPSRTAMFVEYGIYSNDPATAQANLDNVIIDWP